MNGYEAFIAFIIIIAIWNIVETYIKERKWK